MILKKLWGDSEISGRIYLQACELLDAVEWRRTPSCSREQYEKEKKEQTDAVWDVLFSCMHKLTFLRYHMKNYEGQESISFNAARARLRMHNKGQAVDVHEEFEMIAELEAFLHQVKSCLDMAVKLLDVLMQIGVKQLETFGDKGDRVVKLIRRSRFYKNSQAKPRIEHLIEMIEKDRDAWLEQVINMRDVVSHRKGVREFAFGFKEVNGQLEPTYPTINGRRVPELLQLIYENLISFCQDFISVSLQTCFFPPFALIPMDQKAAESKYTPEHGKFVKWTVGAKITMPNKPPTPVDEKVPSAEPTAPTT